MKKQRGKIFLLFSILFMLLAAFFLAYPTVSNLINSIFSKSEISHYDESVSTLSKNVIKEEIKAAEHYNKKLLERDSTSELFYEKVEDYDDVLNFNGIMGYIKIPKINVNLPIYHGSSEKVLEKGAAHMPFSAFPIGGIGNNSVISAHTAFPTQVFFDNLGELENGDLVYITVLNAELVYSVTDKNIVNPEDTSLLKPYEQKDILTLVTCYPYAINSHRLIVTCERYENPSTTDTTTDEAEEKTNSSFEIIILIITAMLVMLLVVIVLKRRTNYGRD